jgi:hypothetical protein
MFPSFCTRSSEGEAPRPLLHPQSLFAFHPSPFTSTFTLHPSAPASIFQSRDRTLQRDTYRKAKMLESSFDTVFLSPGHLRIIILSLTRVVQILEGLGGVS